MRTTLKIFFGFVVGFIFSNVNAQWSGDTLPQPVVKKFQISSLNVVIQKGQNYEKFDGQIVKRLEFDRLGNKILAKNMIVWDVVPYYLNWEAEYTDDGLLTETTNTWEDFPINKEDSAFYQDFGEIKTEIRQNCFYSFHLDRKGRIKTKKETCKHMIESQSYSEEISYSYYPNGKLKETESNRVGKVTREYDENDKVIRRIYESAEVENGRTVCDLKYDRAGRLIEEMELINYSPTQKFRVITSYEYDEEGKLIYQKAVPEVEGGITHQFYYEYDDQGRWARVLKTTSDEKDFVHSLSYRPDGLIDFITVTEKGVNSPLYTKKYQYTFHP